MWNSAVGRDMYDDDDDDDDEEEEEEEEEVTFHRIPLCAKNMVFHKPLQNFLRFFQTTIIWNLENLRYIPSQT